MHRYSILPSLLLVLAISSCAVFKSQVVRFHDLTPQDRGKSFIVMPYKEQEGSLEFRQYAATVSEQMEKQGFVAAENVVEADYAVFMNYSISDGRTVADRTPIYGQTGGGTTYHSGTISSYSGEGSTYGSYSGTSYSTPSFGVVGSVDTSYTLYTRALHLNIVDIRKTTPEKTHTVFEAKVTSSGNKGTFAAVADCIIQAVFTDFPGKSGETSAVNIDGSDCAR